MSHPNCEVISLCDFDSHTIRKAKEKYPDYLITENADDILLDSSIDVVSIASYDNYHYEQIIKGLENNKSLFVEKPICYFENQAKHIHDLLKKKPKLKLSSNLILRKYERFIDLRDRIQSNEFGDLSYIMGGYNYGRLNKITKGWRSKMDYYSGAISGGVHIIDLMLWLTGDKIIEVSSYGNNIQSQSSNFKYNDMVVTTIQFSSGMVGVLTINLGCVHPHFHPFEVYGTKGTFINGLEHASLYKNRDQKNFNENKLVKPDAPRDYNGLEKLYTNYGGIHKGDHIYNFIDSLINDKVLDINAKQIFDVLAVCIAIETSINESKPVRVNYFS